jgi:hypothetical protein
MIRTAIPELTDAIENSMKAIASFRYRQGLLECEEYIYAVEKDKLVLEIRLELIKAKALLKTQKGWRWKALKMTKGNPIKLLFLFMGMWQNFKFKKLWQRIFS